MNGKYLLKFQRVLQPSPSMSDSSKRLLDCVTAACYLALHNDPKGLDLRQSFFLRLDISVSGMFEPIREFICRLTAEFFHNCSTHLNPLVCQIGNYTLLDLHVQCRKYIHKQIKHILL